MRVAVIGAGNVGMAIAADLSQKGHEVCLIKSSTVRSEAYESLLAEGGRILVKDGGSYSEARIFDVTDNLAEVESAEVVIVTIQSTYHEALYAVLGEHLSGDQTVVVVCSYMSSFYLARRCSEYPNIVETTGPYIEGRIDLKDKPGRVVFKVGCRLTKSPLSVFHKSRSQICMKKLHTLYNGWSDDYNIVESALLNPNMVLHTVGAVMSMPRIEYSGGDFCMYREAYSRKNESTLNVMLKLDEEKKQVLKRIGCRPVDVFEAGGFLGNRMESFYNYSESELRAVSPTSVRSRYITEDVSQGLVLMESIAKHAGVDTPVCTSLIDIASAALGEDFRQQGRTVERLDAVRFIENMYR